MVEEKDPDEIGLGEALDLVNSGKSIFVWVGGWTTTPLADLLGIDESKVVSESPFKLILDSKEYPEELKKYDRPIFVCEHGVSSYDLVKELSTMGIKGYSLKGGMEGIKGR
jgi:rhodanese-related sulfurtransferase